MSKITWKGGTLLAPVPAVMVSCGDMENSNVFTVAWTGIINSTPPKTYISVRPSRHSYGMIKESGEFVINLTTEALVRACDSCGVLTGAKVDKFAKFKLTKEKGQEVSAPLIAESPLCLECRVTDIVPLGTHDMFIADIVAVDIEEGLVDADGKLHLEKAKLTAYAHGDYFALGRKLGSFGYSVRKKRTPKKK